MREIQVLVEAAVIVADIVKSLLQDRWKKLKFCVIYRWEKKQKETFYERFIQGVFGYEKVYYAMDAS